YYSEDNFERLARARTIGQEQGVPATAVALAYVLAQPFPTFPLFGPRTITEMRSSTLGLGVELTEADIDWLDLRSEDRKSTRLNSSHVSISYAVFCLKKKT